MLIPRGWSYFGVSCLTRHCCLPSFMGVSGKRLTMMSLSTSFYPRLGLFLSCGSDTLILCAGVVCVSHGRLAWLRFPPSLLLGPNSDARALVVLCRFLNRPLVTFFCSSTVLLRCVIFGSPMLISFSNLVSWPADNLLAQWPVSRHDRDECVRVYIYIHIYIYLHWYLCTSWHMGENNLALLHLKSTPMVKLWTAHELMAAQHTR